MKNAALVLLGLTAALAGGAVGESPWVTEPILGGSTYTIPNPCDPSLLVTITETYTGQQLLKFMDSGTVQFRTDITYSGTGTHDAVPPHHYTTSGTVHNAGEDRQGVAGGVNTEAGKWDYISTDGGPSFREHAQYHVTGIKGDVFTVQFFRDSYICLGGPNQIPKVVNGK